jgi:hypothetical protein
MKRLASIAVLGLALTACGSSGPVTQTNGIGPLMRVAPSPTAFHFSTASNREFARRDIQKLLRIVVLPAGARQVTTAPKTAPRWLRNNWAGGGGSPGAATAQRLWIVHQPLRRVERFVQLHARRRPRPLVPFRSNLSNGVVLHYGTGAYSFAPILGRSWSRWLDVDMAPLRGGSTAVLMRASEYWNHALPRGDELGRAVKRIDITSGYGTQRRNVLVHVRSPYAVGSLVAWMNGLSNQSSVCFTGYGLFLAGGPTVRFTFRSGNGAVLARATVTDLLGRSGPCNPISLTIGKGGPKYLVGADLLLRIQRLLGINLAPLTPQHLTTCLRGWKVVRQSANARSVSHAGERWTVKFPASGRVTVTGPKKPQRLRVCLRASPYVMAYDLR